MIDYNIKNYFMYRRNSGVIIYMEAEVNGIEVRLRELRHIHDPKREGSDERMRLSFLRLFLLELHGRP
jgi:hypothetical protein